MNVMYINLRRNPFHNYLSRIMALSSHNWDIINNNLFVEGAKYWRGGHFNYKTWEEYYVCSEQKKSKCPCSAMVRYIVRPTDDSLPEEDQDVSHDVTELLDPRLDKEKYDVVSLVLHMLKV